MLKDGNRDELQVGVPEEKLQVGGPQRDPDILEVGEQEFPHVPGVDHVGEEEVDRLPPNDLLLAQSEPHRARADIHVGVSQFGVPLLVPLYAPVVQGGGKIEDRVVIPPAADIEAEGARKLPRQLEIGKVLVLGDFLRLLQAHGGLVPQFPVQRQFKWRGGRRTLRLLRLGVAGGRSHEQGQEEYRA